jgi:riboflavin kinase/FMN adenylyltransferase
VSRVLQSLDDVRPAPRVVALGTFDGVHLGHRHLITTAVEAGRAAGQRSTVATFHPRPISVLVPDRAPDALCSLARRVALIDELEPDETLVLRFTRELAALSAQDFVAEVLVGILTVAHVVVGENWAFGRGRSGSPEVLRGFGERHGFDVTVVPLQRVDGHVLSSSRVRELIGRGAVDEAARLLGRPPSLEGAVVRGDARGREIGVPTANLGLPPGHVFPAEGVYAGDVVLPPGERRLRAAISVGTNPTFDGTRSIRVEAHILDFDEDIYGSPMRVEFRRRLRGQERYASVEALVAQMRRDIEASRT